MAKGHGGHSGHTGRGSGSNSSTPMTNEAASRIQSAGAGKNCRQLAHVRSMPSFCGFSGISTMPGRPMSHVIFGRPASQW